MHSGKQMAIQRRGEKGEKERGREEKRRGEELHSDSIR